MLNEPILPVNKRDWPIQATLSYSSHWLRSVIVFRLAELLSLALNLAGLLLPRIFSSNEVLVSGNLAGSEPIQGCVPT